MWCIFLPTFWSKFTPVSRETRVPLLARRLPGPIRRSRVGLLYVALDALVQPRHRWIWAALVPLLIWAISRNLIKILRRRRFSGNPYTKVYWSERNVIWVKFRFSGNPNRKVYWSERNVIKILRKRRVSANPEPKTYGSERFLKNQWKFPEKRRSSATPNTKTYWSEQKIRKFSKIC